MKPPAIPRVPDTFQLAISLQKLSNCTITKKIGNFEIFENLENSEHLENLKNLGNLVNVEFFKI